MHRDGFKGVASFENDLNLVYQKILLNSSLRLEIYGTEMKIFLLASKSVSVFSVRFDDPIWEVVFE